MVGDGDECEGVWGREREGEEQTSWRLLQFSVNNIWKYYLHSFSISYVSSAKAWNSTQSNKAKCRSKGKSSQYLSYFTSKKGHVLNG